MDIINSNKWTWGFIESMRSTNYNEYVIKDYVLEDIIEELRFRDEIDKYGVMHKSGVILSYKEACRLLKLKEL